MKRNEIINFLKNGIVEVIFSKVDGTERVMQCTLSESIVDYSTLHGSTANTSAEILRVYDVEKKDWRSFKLGSIKSVKVL